MSRDFIQAKKAGNIVISENKSTHSNILKLYSKRIDCYVNDRASTLWELSRASVKSSVNFDDIYEALLIMSQTAHIGYSNSKDTDFYYKGDFIKSMDIALEAFFASDEFHQIINRYTVKVDDGF